ncbi:hypothetical protein GCM10007939_05950 [Amylibacter marinus]|uniref:Polyketide cyclase / dehydrase and lipid transport n=1 Tax=Amylibacter marinus TaxID=1475483 RepID=A0ABQ5VSS2_9RHOB|nr:SRPBCC family protein [Amylibacter marinus]GLQ34312.1 hypothetical protein GCM10007939_05950 [Amylibacter marinus]
MLTYRQVKSAWPHFTATSLGLYFAWSVSQGPYLRSSIQFTGPALLVLLFHITWLLYARGFHAGFSAEVHRRTAISACGLALGVINASLFAPMPSQAAHADNTVETLLIVIVCSAVIALITGIISGVLYLLFLVTRALLGMLKTGKDDQNSTRLFEFASVASSILILLLTSLEGLPQSFTFDTHQRSTARQHIDADADTVWAALETATSPSFAVPQALRLLPIPVAVELDEGIGLNAKRRVRFEGREGSGHMSLQVIERTEEYVVFEIQSDSSPMAQWITHRKLKYHVIPQAQGTELHVSLEFNRRLAPGWFFKPFMGGATYLAMDVLARDVKLRSET